MAEEIENTSDQPVSSCSGLRHELLQCLLASECVREVRVVNYVNFISVAY